MTLERLQYYAFQSGKEEGEMEKALEDALILVNDFNVSPELATEKMGVPLADVLEMLKKDEMNHA